ncbi:quinoprotein relay system zinc metallohydrolase 2 [Roseovarius sp. M141]|uniref:quinoprotein relay system zinc metallohydrolase 2 n=1 Tax=Roseovarius sp. M141 TaxID=2583806 RepID=UPI0020CED6C3|nr:quinoprotein relay system zinc metallohydrolase 2 [Roseovarius sp. M141]MCQ0093120.1 quinoprotein relay system zinc metallohydrolase 2 [Roseovarius sp. M141]
MFEAVVTLCLIGTPQMCRDVLLPGFEASTPEACMQALATADLPQFPDLRGAAAVCRPLGAGAAFTQIAPGVFAHRGIVSDAAQDNLGDVANIGFVVGSRAVAVIDTGGSRMVGESVYRSIRRETDLPIRHVVLTHMHPDHVLGASVFADAGAEIVGHARLADALRDRAPNYLDTFAERIGKAAFIGTTVALPTTEFSESLTIDLGGRALELRAWPTAHSTTDITVHDSHSGVLFTGDLVVDVQTPSLDGSLTGWQAVLAEMAALDLSQIVPGHGGPLLDWPEASVPMLRYLDVLGDDTRAAIAAGSSLGEAVETIGQSEAANWQLFDLFNPRNATVAFTELEWE